MLCSVSIILNVTLRGFFLDTNPSKLMLSLCTQKNSVILMMRTASSFIALSFIYSNTRGSKSIKS